MRTPAPQGGAPDQPQRLVAGRMFDTTGSYKSFFVLALVLYGLAVIAAAVLRPRSASAASSAARSSAS